MKTKTVLRQGDHQAFALPSFALPSFGLPSFGLYSLLTCTFLMFCSAATVMGENVRPDIPHDAAREPEPDVAPKAPRFEKPIVPPLVAGGLRSGSRSENNSKTLDGAMWECRLQASGAGYGATVDIARDRAFTAAMKNLTTRFNDQSVDRFVVISSIDVASDTYEDFAPTGEHETWFAVCKLDASIFFLELATEPRAPSNPFSDDDIGGQLDDPLETLLEFLNGNPGY